MKYENLSILMVFINAVYFCRSNHISRKVAEFSKLEGNLLKIAKDYIDQERERLNHLKEKVNEWKEMRDALQGQEKLYIQNPLNMIHLFKMLTGDLDKVEKKMISNSFEKIFDKKLSIPTNDDLKEGVNSLLKLQHQYDLKPSELMHGKLLDFETNEHLLIENCIFIGEICMENNNYVCVTDWLSNCLIYTQNDSQKKKVLKMLYPSYLYLGNKELAHEYASQYESLDFLDISANNIRLKTGMELGKLIDRDPYILESRRTCRGFYSNALPTQNHKCRYNHENSPFLKIAPLKEEELYIEPKIVIYREVIYDSEIETIKSLSLDMLNSASVYSRDGKSILPGFIYRIGETTFLDNTSSFFEKLSLRIRDMSMLSLEQREMWQIINYAPGGFHRLHTDFIPTHADRFPITGNRLMTLLFYMNNVTLGGGTAFPRLKLLVMPTKGSALMWHNMNPDGSKNVWLEHCGCPVVLGEKWAFTQWIGANGQHTIRNFYSNYEKKPGQRTFQPPAIEDVGRVSILENVDMKTLWDEVSQLRAR